jgi:hypothetical protein
MVTYTARMSEIYKVLCRIQGASGTRMGGHHRRPGPPGFGAEGGALPSRSPKTDIKVQWYCMGQALELSPKDLRNVCNPDSLDFETTAGVAMLSEVLGQPRAVAAFSFGTSVTSPGFNLFALGQPGSGKTTLPGPRHAIQKGHGRLCRGTGHGNSQGFGWRYSRAWHSAQRAATCYTGALRWTR